LAIPLFLDTSFIVARYNPSDSNAAAAMAWLDEAAGRRGPPVKTITTDYVFDEVITAVLARTRRHSSAAGAGLALRNSRSCEISVINREMVERAWALFLARPDKTWSLTDCTSFVVMRALGLKAALTFDQNFAEAGFEMVP
jgi:predicted nucleic acid-binding protein